VAQAGPKTEFRFPQRRLHHITIISEHYPVAALVSSTVPTKLRLSETGSRLSRRTCKSSGCGQRWRKSAPKCRLRIVAQQNQIRKSTTPCFIQYCNHCLPGRDQSHFLKKGLVSAVDGVGIGAGIGAGTDKTDSVRCKCCGARCGYSVITT
jgi:hypothetical protein